MLVLCGLSLTCFARTQTCWIPVLEAFVDGILYSKPAVSIASIQALCRALLVDKHATVAPPAVMMKIMAKLLAPTVSVATEEDSSLSSHELENAVPITTDAETTRAVADSAIVESDAKTEEKLSIGTDDKNDDADSDPDLAYVAAVEELLCALCNLFLLQLKRLNSSNVHPDAFDKLWFQLLHVLGLMLHEKKEIHGEVSSGTIEHTEESEPQGGSMLCVTSSIDSTRQAAYDQLKNMLMVAVVSGIFQSKPTLWSLTCDYIKTQYKYCPNIIEELFPK